MAKNIVKPGSTNVPRKGASSSTDISQFLKAAEGLRKSGADHGGLVFPLDATMSRQATWDNAMNIQAQMFDAVGAAGGLDVQLVYFRGYNECRASKWVGNPSALRDLMTGIDCRGGHTQIRKVLAHAKKEAAKKNPVNANRSRVDALVFVGDAMEEDVDTLCHTAGQLGVLGVPCFMFQEGRDAMAEAAFREIARLSNGAFMRFDSGSAKHLAELLNAVANFVSGGRRALENSNSREARLLLEQMR